MRKLSSRPGTTEETGQRLNAKCDPGLDPETIKRFPPFSMEDISGWNLNMICRLANNSVTMLIYWFW